MKTVSSITVRILSQHIISLYSGFNVKFKTLKKERI